MERDLPIGVLIIAAVFFLSAAYLLGAGVIALVNPGLLSMAVGSSLLGGLEIWGPYMFLLAAAAGTAIGWGLLKLWNWARRVAIVLALLGVALAVPAVSGSVVSLRAAGIFWGGLRIIARVMIVWYLYQEPVKEAFAAPRPS